MLKINKYFILTSFFAVFNFFVSNSQSYVGISGGISKVKFMDFTNDENYNSKYHIKNGMSFSSFYETKNDSISNLKIELQYKFQNANMIISNTAGHFSFYKNLNYSFQQLNLNLMYSFRLLESIPLKIYYSFGTVLAYTLNTKAESNGWNYIYETQMDSLGNSISVLTISNWTKNESKSKDLSQFNFGVNTGFDFMIPMFKKLDFIVQNRYEIFLTNMTTIDKLKYTSLMTGQLNIGLRYNFSRL